MLVEMGQGHLFEYWVEPGIDDEEKKAFFDQVCCNILALVILFWLVSGSVRMQF